MKGNYFPGLIFGILRYLQRLQAERVSTIINLDAFVQCLRVIFS